MRSLVIGLALLWGYFAFMAVYALFYGRAALATLFGVGP